MPTDKFVNPYNFISLPDHKEKAYTDKDRHIGAITYTITTETPLFIPNSSSETAFSESTKVKDHKSYDFFSYTDLNADQKCEDEYQIPVIPGSEIRGVVRNVYETLTDSCMGMLNEESHPIKRTAEAFSPALFYRDKKGTIVLYQATSFRIGEKAYKGRKPYGFEKYKNGEKLYYQRPERNEKGGYKPISRYSGQSGKYKAYGYLLKWGMGGRKERYHLFVLKPDQKGKNERKGRIISRDEIERKLFSVIDSYLDQPALKQKPDDEKAYKEYRNNLEEFLKGQAGEYFPVNYSVLQQGIQYFAPAIFSKEFSNHSIGDLAGEFAPCKSDFCRTCDLFGHIGKENESAVGSRIRFTDLYVTEQREAKQYYLCDKITLETLGGPKTGNVDFYLKRPDKALFWTYDYFITGEGKQKLVKVQPGELRGRKYYWHHQRVELSSNIKPTNLNKTVRPVDVKVTFKGKMYFDGISQTQLEQMIWILNSGTESLGLKLGSGKPLGLGSVSCNVLEVEERSISSDHGYLSYSVKKSKVKKKTYEDVRFSKSVKNQFYKIAGLYSIPADVPITYPRDTGNKTGPLENGYHWYVTNHGGTKMRTKRAQMRIEHSLPEICDEEIGLPYKEWKNKK